MNIYVGNLSFDTTESGLRELFEAHGAVESTSVITDKFTGRSRGFGFVTMPNDEEARAAINAVNGRSVGGRNLTVNEARPRTEGGSRDRDSRGPRRDRAPRW